MNERQQAWQIGNQWLDQRMNPLTQMVPGDPDCDACVIARQYMRALDTIAQLQEAFTRLWDGEDFTEEMKKHLTENKWPASIQSSPFR